MACIGIILFYVVTGIAIMFLHIALREHSENSARYRGILRPFLSLLPGDSGRERTVRGFQARRLSSELGRNAPAMSYERGINAPAGHLSNERYCARPQIKSS